MRATLLLLLLLAATTSFQRDLHGQSPETEVEATIRELFDAMRAGDAATAAAIFHPDARLHSVSVQDGTSALNATPISGFVEAIGTPHDEVWDERIRDLEIRVDGGLAQAWMRYWFYLGDTLSHCGVNAFQLVRVDDTWQVLQVTDTRRRDGCGTPD